MTDVLIIGQGLCGTWLALELERAGLGYMVIDEQRAATASRAAAGLINPVTGRRIVKTWMIDELMPFAEKAYREAGEVLGGMGEVLGGMGEVLGGTLIRRTTVVDFFPTAQMRLAFLQRYEEGAEYLRLPEDEGRWRGAFHYDLGYGMIDPCYLVDVQGLLGAMRRRMIERGELREEAFEQEALVTDDGGVRYGDIEARWVIFCDGVESAESMWWRRLPFAPNKGEVLIIAAEGLDLGGMVFKKGVSIAPWKEGLYWVGSSYEWSFVDDKPTAVFRERTEAVLREWLKVPFSVVEHLAAVRPATLERRPFVGLHPREQAVGILNGMGTKGCSLAPYFARQLVELLVEGKGVRADADVRRFTKVLGR